MSELLVVFLEKCLFNLHKIDGTLGLFSGDTEFIHRGPVSRTEYTSLDGVDFCLRSPKGAKRFLAIMIHMRCVI